ncbi:MAG: TonB-dependent receptor [Sphingomicrobium sp.]
MRRLFGVIDTGEFGPFGTRAFLSASRARNDLPFNQYGKIRKNQYNAKIYQPVGSNGDFVAIAGNWNENRNNFFGSVPLRTDTTGGRVVGSGTGNRFPLTAAERRYTINYPCQTAVAHPGVADSTNSCGTEFDRRYNPSNTGNIRINSRFTLMPNLVLTVDPSYQYVTANGGGTVTAREYGFDINPAKIGTTANSNCSTTPDGPAVTCVPGYFGGSPYFGGVDLNGDGDKLDQVTVLAASETRTRRYGVIAGLRYDVAPGHSIRVNYTHDYGNHRQTGEVIGLTSFGEPNDVFPINAPLTDVNGNLLQKRDRQSFAILNQLSGEYRGEIGPLVIDLGLRSPWFKRDLQQNCFTTSAGGFVDCTSGPVTAQYEAFNPATSNPDHRVLKYHKLLPQAGLIYTFTPQISAFANYSKNLSVPGTDNLYNAFYFAANTPQAKPAPETTDSVDTGLRYRTSTIQAQVTGWYTKFTNRLASAYDPVLDATVYRNLGAVDKYGIDGSVSYAPVKEFTLYAFASYLKSKIKDNQQNGTLPTGVTCDSIAPNDPNARFCAFTAGKRESGSPVYTYGVSAVATFGPIALGATAKRTGKRYIYDDNRAVYSGDIASPTQIYSAAAPAYWLVNLDARLNLSRYGMKGTFLQFNAYNIFNTLYVGGFGGGLTQAQSSRAASGVKIPTYGSPPFVQIGAPRTLSASINLQF